MNTSTWTNGPDYPLYSTRFYQSRFKNLQTKKKEDELGTSADTSGDNYDSALDKQMFIITVHVSIF